MKPVLVSLLQNMYYCYGELHREITAQKTTQKGDLCENIRSEGKHFNEKYIHSILHEKQIKLSTFLSMKIPILFKTPVSNLVILHPDNVMALLETSFQLQTAYKLNVVLNSIFKQLKYTDTQN